MTRSPAPWFGVVLLMAAVALFGCSGGNDRESAPGSTSATSAAGPEGASLDPPGGWAVSPDGLATAAVASDLDAELTSGPRAVLVRDAAAVDPLAALAASLKEVPYTVVAGPDATVVDGSPGVAITVRWTTAPVGSDAQGIDYVGRFITVRSPASENVLFELTAPADRWDAAAPVLEQIPSLG